MTRPAAGFPRPELMARAAPLEPLWNLSADRAQPQSREASKKPSRTASACGRRNGCDLSSWWKGAADGFLVACTPQKNMVHGLLRT
jgi:hypothetical protein